MNINRLIVLGAILAVALGLWFWHLYRQPPIEYIMQMAAVLFAALAAFGAVWAAFETKQAVQDQLFAKLVDEYSAPDMLEALRKLPELRKMTVRSAITQDSELDEARRKIHWYYKKVWALYELRALSDDQVKHLSSFHGYDLWHELALPTSHLIDPGPDTKAHLAWAERFDKWRQRKKS